MRPVGSRFERRKTLQSVGADPRSFDRPPTSTELLRKSVHCCEGGTRMIFPQILRAVRGLVRGCRGLCRTSGLKSRENSLFQRLLSSTDSETGLCCRWEKSDYNTRLRNSPLALRCRSRWAIGLDDQRRIGRFLRGEQPVRHILQNPEFRGRLRIHANDFQNRS